MARYKTISGSHTAHCCFEASVIDTQNDKIAMCECIDEESAKRICDALNAAEAETPKTEEKTKWSTADNGIGDFLTDLAGEKVFAVIERLEGGLFRAVIERLEGVVHRSAESDVPDTPGVYVSLEAAKRNVKRYVEYVLNNAVRLV